MAIRPTPSPLSSFCSLSSFYLFIFELFSPLVAALHVELYVSAFPLMLIRPVSRSAFTLILSSVIYFAQPTFFPNSAPPRTIFYLVTPFTVTPEAATLPPSDGPISTISCPLKFVLPHLFLNTPSPRVFDFRPRDPLTGSPPSLSVYCFFYIFYSFPPPSSPLCMPLYQLSYFPTLPSTALLFQIIALLFFLFLST